MNNKFENELKPDRLYFSPWFYCIILSVIFGLIAYNFYNENEKWNNFTIISVSFFLIGIILSRHKVIIRVEGNNLLLIKSLFSNPKINYYDLNKIDNLSYKRDVKSILYFSNGQVRVMGVDVTPDSMRRYYYHKEILSFDFDGKRIHIGKWKKDFNGEKLYKIIKEISNKAQHAI